MTNIECFMHPTMGYEGFRVSGHADSADYGHDLVCAAVSSVTDFVIALIADTMKLDCVCDIQESSAVVDVKLLPTKKNMEAKNSITHIISAYHSYLSDLSAQFPKNIKCTKI